MPKTKKKTKPDVGGRPRLSPKALVRTSSICFTQEDERALLRIMKRLKTENRSRAVGWCIQEAARAIKEPGATERWAS